MIYPRAEATLSHNTCISAITSTSCLGLEHVVVMPLVVAVSEAVSTEGHALGDAASLASESHKVGCPDKPAHDGVVVLLHVVREVIRSPPPSHQPPAPVNSLPIIDIFLWVQQVIQKSLIIKYLFIQDRMLVDNI